MGHGQTDSVEDCWNWPWLFYIGTVVLNLSEERFWNLTPWQYRILFEQHIEYQSMINGTKSPLKKQEQKQQFAFIDQVM